MAQEDSKFIKYQDNKVQIKTKAPAGSNVAVYVRPGDKIDLEALGINLDTAKFKLIGGDMVLEIPGSGSFTFVSLALMGFNTDAPEFIGLGGKITTLSSLLSNMDEINALPINSVATSEFVNIPDATSDQEKKNKTTEENQNQATPQVIVIDNNVAADENSNISESLAESASVDVAKSVDVATTVNINTSTKTSSSSSSSSKTEESIVEGIVPTLSFDIDVQHVEISESTLSDASGNALVVYGGGGISYTNIYPNTYNTSSKTGLIAQTTGESIDYSTTGSASYDRVIIYADDPTLFDSTTTSRTVSLTATQPEGFEITQLTISSDSLPSGFEVINGVKSGNTWTIQKDDESTDAVEGFTIDSSGAITFTFSVNNTVDSNFVFNLSATSVFSLDNVSEANQTTIVTPTITTIEYEKEYAVQVKSIDDLTDSSEYAFDSFYLNGTLYTSGFVITSNINSTETKGSQSLVNTIFGGTVNDTIYGGLKSDTIYGNTGDDTIITRAGDDLVDGGAGLDTLDYSEINNANDIGINANLNTGIVTGDGTDTISNIENIIATQNKDTIVGNDEINILKGEAGADTISGRAGDDTIEGGTGNDTIKGGLGEDLLKGDAGTDTVSYEDATTTGTAGVTVTLEVSSDTSGLGSATGIDGIDTLWNFENITGSNYADTIIGNSGINILNGLAGNDTIIGNAGNDTIYGGEGIDTVDFSGATSAEEVDLSNNRATGGDGRDSIYTVENVIGSLYNDTITGDALDNVLDGNEGNDIISGGAGNDTLRGGLDNDTLTGGAGNDYLDGGENGTSVGAGDYAIL